VNNSGWNNRKKTKPREKAKPGKSTSLKAGHYKERSALHVAGGVVESLRVRYPET
jgi:hypothetical protein